MSTQPTPAERARNALMSLNSKPLGGSRSWDEAVSAIAAAIEAAEAAATVDALERAAVLCDNWPYKQKSLVGFHPDEVAESLARDIRALKGA